MKILGISAYYHDSAAALVDDDQILAACHEERFTRIKHDSDFPAHAIKACLNQAGLRASDVDAIVFFEKPFLKFERLLETYLSVVPKGWETFKMAIPLWLKEKLFQKRLLREELIKLGFSEKQTQSILFSDHHLSHAASAYYPSPFKEALILTMDGVGEWATTSLSIGRGATIQKIREIHFPHSIGMLYSAFTSYCGFKVNSGEYKLMGLAPYGQPKYVEEIRNHLIDIKDDGSFALDMSYFNYCGGLTMVTKKFEDLFGGPIRKSESALEQRHMDLAASVQQVLEIIVLKMTKSLREEFKIPNLCMAGGVALNCVANAKILNENIFDGLWIQPAAGDAGGALGAALAALHLNFKKPRPDPVKDSMKQAYLGPEYSEQQIEEQLRALGAHFEKLPNEKLMNQLALDLNQGLSIGWFQGRMEYGPRSLGARSILGDARQPDMQKNLNLKVKFRESFRPFAPAVLRSDLEKYFDLSVASPYMLLVAQVKKERQKKASETEDSLFGIDKLNCLRSDIPAVTHIDYSARVQTVDDNLDHPFPKLLKAFKQLTGCSVLVNTSFNVRGEPIVESPRDAYRCFMGTQIERLAIGNFYLRKELQDPRTQTDYKFQFELD